MVTKHIVRDNRIEASEFAKQLGKRHAFDLIEEELFVCMLRTMDMMSTSLKQ